MAITVPVCIAGCCFKQYNLIVAAFTEKYRQQPREQVAFRETANMPQGNIKKLVTERGFGFIETEQGDLFFHMTALDGCTFEELHEGQTVEFEVGQGPKGARAENVKPV